MKTLFLSTSALGILLLAVACGGESRTVSSNGLAGVYTVDVDRTLGASGRALQGPAVGHVRATLGEEGYRLELTPTGGFTLTIRSGETTFATSGSWRPTSAGLELVTTSVEGDPVTEDTREQVTVDGDHLVLSPAEGQRIYLRRL